MKTIAVLLLILAPFLQAQDLKLTDRLAVNIGVRIGGDPLKLDTPEAVKYTPAHPNDSPAEVGGMHEDPDLYLSTSALTTGLEIRLTRWLSVEGGIAWNNFYSTSRSEQQYPPYNSYTYLDADIDDAWVAEPYVQVSWTFFDDTDVARCSLSVGHARTDSIRAEYKRGWYRWGGYELDAVHSAEIEGELWYLQWRMSTYVGFGVLVQINVREWDAVFDTGDRSKDRGIGFALGLEYRY